MKRLIILLLSITLVLTGVAFWFFRTQWVPPHLRSDETHSVLYADFDEEDKRQSGEIRVVIPEVYELMNIAIALTETSQNNPYRYADHGAAYYQEVMDYFGSYDDHPLIAEVEASLRRFPSHRAIFDYVFKGDEIVPGGPFAGSWRDSVFEDYLPLMEDFAVASDFRQFFADHQDFYEEQVALYKEFVPLRNIWTWMENEFPNRYDAYTVVISPLVRGTHNTFCYRDEAGDDHWEMVMFVSGPTGTSNPEISQQVREALITRSVFTEIDHNYVNPVTDNAEYLDRIDLAMRDFRKWNTQRGYGNPAQTFNEYMTWATYTLFAKDYYDADVFAEANAYTVDQMEGQRGFPRFGAFNAALLDLYENRASGTTVADLYPDVLAWLKAQ
jgi:hypothetical protein